VSQDTGGSSRRKQIEETEENASSYDAEDNDIIDERDVRIESRIIQEPSGSSMTPNIVQINISGALRQSRSPPLGHIVLGMSTLSPIAEAKIQGVPRTSSLDAEHSSKTKQGLSNSKSPPQSKLVTERSQQ
jgi:hypothetical protein